MKTIGLFLALLSFTMAGSADEPSAEQLLAQAKAKASAEHKTIFVHFGASWCGWCRRLDSFLDRSDIKPVFEKYFVPVKLVVQEKDKALENKGADAVLKKLGGPAGLPYFGFLDQQGGFIVNSKKGGQIIGYPGEPGELDWFVQMLKKAAPSLAAGDLNTIEAALKGSWKKDLTQTSLRSGDGRIVRLNVRASLNGVCLAVLLSQNVRERHYQCGFAILPVARAFGHLKVETQTGTDPSESH